MREMLIWWRCRSSTELTQTILLAKLLASRYINRSMGAVAGLSRPLFIPAMEVIQILRILVTINSGLRGMVPLPDPEMSMLLGMTIARMVLAYYVLRARPTMVCPGKD